jgi:hypothetical protein
MTQKQDKQRSKRHHYVSQFVLDAFTVPEPSADAGMLWRFERGSECPVLVPPRRAAARITYNTVALPSGEKIDVFEKILASVERPVVYVDPTERPRAWGVALLHDSVELTFPISATRCLLATHDLAFREKVIGAGMLRSPELRRQALAHQAVRR